MDLEAEKKHQVDEDRRGYASEAQSLPGIVAFKVGAIPKEETERMIRASGLGGAR